MTQRDAKARCIRTYHLGKSEWLCTRAIIGQQSAHAPSWRLQSAHPRHDELCPHQCGAGLGQCTGWAPIKQLIHETPGRVVDQPPGRAEHQATRSITRGLRVGSECNPSACGHKLNTTHQQTVQTPRMMLLENTESFACDGDCTHAQGRMVALSTGGGVTDDTAMRCCDPSALRSAIP